jgi:NAD(P)-dependent dehydrogenase (short-subunit alcohol dehydrogenase family)
MNLELSGKVAIVTGGNRGIGANIAEELAREGVDLFLVARDSALLDRVAGGIAAKFGRQVVAHAADLRPPEAAAQAIEAAIAAFGRIDILVNNAGATKRAPFLDLTEDEWMDGFALKFHGYVRMARTAWPELRRRQGAIVNIIGIGSRAGSAEFTIGGSVNAALVNLTKALADLGRADGVRVNAINPGRIETDRLVRNLDRLAAEAGVQRDEAAARLLSGLGLKRFGRPEEIGWLVAYLASPRAAFIEGAIIDIDGGENRSV